MAPFVLAITHPDGADANGHIFEVGAGFIAEIRWERSKGQLFKTVTTFTPSAVRFLVLLIVCMHRFMSFLSGTREVGTNHGL